MKSVKSIGLAVLCTLALMAGTASAQSSSGFYVGLAGGASFLSDSDFDVLGAVNVDNEYDPGYAVAGFAGYDFGSVWTLGGVRLEGEISYRQNDIDVHSVAALGGDQPGSDGEASALAFMANVYNDFLPGSPFRPYVGAGVGAAVVDFSGYRIAAIPNVLDDDDTTFAWQLMAGVSYDLTEQMSLGGEYRYFAAEPELTSSPATQSVNNDIDYDSHSIFIRLNYRL